MTLDRDDQRLIYFYAGVLPSAFVRYWFDENGILHQRVIEKEEWQLPEAGAHQDHGAQ